MSQTKDVSWVVTGGKIGETGYCTRCGEGFILPSPISIPDLTKGISAFVAKHADCPEGEAANPKITTPWDWLASRDVGVSSATIFSVMMGYPSPFGRYDHPYDSADFGRCDRLLAHFPEWKPRLLEVSAKYPFWDPFVRAWDKLTALYQHENSNKSAVVPTLYNYLKELEAEARPLKPATAA